MTSGSVIQNSAYDISMGKTDFKVLCRKEMTRKEASLLAQVPIALLRASELSELGTI